MNTYRQNSATLPLGALDDARAATYTRRGDGLDRSLAARGQANGPEGGKGAYMLRKYGMAAALGLATILGLMRPIQAQTSTESESSRTTAKTAATRKSAAAAQSKSKNKTKTESDKKSEAKQPESKGKTKMEIATFGGG